MNATKIKVEVEKVDLLDVVFTQDNIREMVCTNNYALYARPSFPVSDAVVSAMQYCPLRTLLYMQSCPGLCKNRPVYI